MIKAIVADDNALVREMLVDSLDEDTEIEVVATATNGEEAIELIKAWRPDVVLLDLVMPIVDGIGVMEAIENTGDKMPCFIIISAAGKEEIVTQALEAGASYFFMKPFNGNALVKKVKQLCGITMISLDKKDTTAIKAPDNGTRITDLLHILYIPVKMIGYKYLKEAIMIGLENTDRLIAITKSIYPVVAEKFGTSPGNVERNIRYLLETAWPIITEKVDARIISDIFNGIKKKPTNTEFVVCCAEWLKFH